MTKSYQTLAVRGDQQTRIEFADDAIEFHITPPSETRHGISGYLSHDVVAKRIDDALIA